MNAHEKEEEDQSSYFGLRYSDCDRNSLEYYEKERPERYFHMPEKSNGEIHSELSKLNVKNSSTVISFANNKVFLFSSRHVSDNSHAILGEVLKPIC